MRAVLVTLGGLLGVALGYDKNIECINGIRTAIAEFTFTGGSPLSYWENICQNKLAVESEWAAAKVYCNEKQIKAGSKHLADYCMEYGMVELIPYSEIEPMLTDDFIASLEVVGYNDINATKIWDHPVLLSKDFYTAGYETTYTFQKEYMTHKRYGWAVYGFWGTILLIGILHRFYTHISNGRRTKSQGDVEDHGAKSRSKNSTSIFSTAYHWARANLIIPAAFGSHHNRLLWGCTVPTRMETLIVASFWIINIVLCCVSYEAFWPNLYYTKAMQLWRYVADRTGIMSYANLPILWMFSGRNNIFLWLTGWSFSTFNIFHRHVARIATLQAIVHSIAYTAMEANFHQLAESWKEKYWYMGGMATIAMGLIVFFSSVWFRKHSYEFFLLLHIVFSVLTIVGLFFHTAIFDGEYDGYLWPLVAIWCFDRFARLVRLAYCNLHVKFSKGLTMSTTIASYDKTSDLIRLDVIPASGLLKPGPGQHYFIYQPNRWKGWENHPFTLAHWTELDNGEQVATLDPDSDSSSDLRKEVKVTAKAPSSQASSSSVVVEKNGGVPTKQVTGRYKLTFFVRPFSSWTRRLRDECIKSKTGMHKTQALIEGPYGEKSPLHTFENVIFILGGTGISGALPYMQEHLQRTASNPSKTRTRDITCIWACKQPEMIREIASSELQPLLGREDIHFKFYLTSKEASASTKAVELKSSSSSDASTEVTITPGRPNIKEHVRTVIDEVNAAGAVGGKIAILTCGPAAMADAARVAVHRALKDGKRGVEYFEETFGW
ncbi:Ferric/cupric reductase transmembrane component B [Exophiala dermatitidis]